MKSIISAILFLSVFIGTPVNADTYDAAKSRLTIPYLQVGDTIYTDVVLVIGRLLGYSGPTAVATTAVSKDIDVYNPQEKSIHISYILVGDWVFTNVYITPAWVVSVGGTKPVTDGTGCTDAMLKAGFDKIIIGMTVNQVKNIFGCSYNLSAGPDLDARAAASGKSQSTLTWIASGVTVGIGVTFPEKYNSMDDTIVVAKVSHGF